MIETIGWDTHNQQEPRLVWLLAGFDAMLAALRTGMGQAWTKTTVLVATEFGRTVAVNGTNGTDHGTATARYADRRCGARPARPRRLAGPFSVLTLRKSRP